MPTTRTPLETSPAALIDSLSEPSEPLIEMMARLHGDLLILGAGGKMGPTVARMAQRAMRAAKNPARVFAVSRFSNEREAAESQNLGIHLLRGDLLDYQFIRSLPDVANVVSLIGMKFGGADSLPEIWATNTCAPGLVADRFRNSHLVALSTGNVYALAPVQPGTGAVETDPPAPIGEYGMSAVGRERVFQHFSRKHNIPLVILRLNYATEFRYGVLVDLAQQVNRGESISLAMGYFNAIWQRDACDVILRSLEVAATPPRILNLTGAQRISSRQVCEQFGQLLGKAVRFDGLEAGTALLSDASESVRLFGRPPTSLDTMISHTADWIRRGGETWNKPTHFQVRDGKF